MKDVVQKVRKLISLYKDGALGGEIMPEDNNPKLAANSDENLLYFTLPMALNYQRNSYKLWESALLTWNDETTCDVFDPNKVMLMNIENLRDKLVKYKVALQPNKQPIIWKKLCSSFIKYSNGSLKKFFEKLDFDILRIKQFILNNKPDFPYLSGTKILNYWLYVLTQYTAFKFKNRNEISVAPDTHVLQASLKLGIISEMDMKKSDIRDLVSEKWKTILNGSGIEPIDLHTPFWLWSRNGFKVEV